MALPRSFSSGAVNAIRCLLRGEEAEIRGNPASRAC